MKNPPLHRYATRPGLYFTDDGGADVVVRSETADQVWLCVLEPIDEPSAFFQDAIRLFEDPNISFIQQIHEFPVCTRIIEHLYLRETLFRMTGPNYGLWYVHLPKAWDGMRYGYRVDGAWDPKHGVRFNPYKFLLDPYGKGIDGSMELTPAAFSYECDVVDRKVIGSAYGAMSTVDSLGHMPVSVAIDDRDTHKHEGDPQHPHVPWRKTVIYEMHVKGFTANAPWLPESLRGTYAGLAHPTTLAYLQGLGITSIELLPIMAKQDELFLQEHGRKNYWGYSTLSYFAPEPSYATKAAQEKGAAAVRQEVIDMVRALHEAGFEVIMDVVYNHTCEGGVEGPTVCWRGLDDLAYYRHQKSNTGRLEDTTGCGNTLDFTNTHVVTFAIDSLRYWAKRIGIDGFRFDLGVTLARLEGEFTHHHPFLYALRSDLLLGNLKLIMEPWDLGNLGWRTGQFSVPFAEWNDRFRDTARTFWLEDVDGGSDFGRISLQEMS
ncbi:alpha-amylase family glycosyl hydrolase, partial [Bifidobacterium longum subsp. longum]